MKSKCLLISLLFIGLLSCETDDKRENEKDSSKENAEVVSAPSNEQDDTVNGEEGAADDEEVTPPVYIQEGALSGVFTVSETKKVRFSKGNLQYQASTKTWRFAEYQYDIVGIGYEETNDYCFIGGTILSSDNRKISSTYNGWIDLFGWGTGANPTLATDDSNNYLNFVDWGENKISNGGNVANVWRTLSPSEWYYLLRVRPQAKNKAGIACVGGINGLVILPDNWKLPSGFQFTPGLDMEHNYGAYDNWGVDYYKEINNYTKLDWQVMEKAGAIFLPAAGYRVNTSVYTVGGYGYYWSSENYNAKSAYFMEFQSGNLNPSNFYERSYGRSVRLCVDL